MSNNPDVHEWEAVLESLPARLIFRHPSLNCDDLLFATERLLTLPLSWHHYRSPYAPDEHDPQIDAFVEAIEKDLALGKVVVVNSLIKLVHHFMAKGQKFILAYGTHAGAEARLKENAGPWEIAELWHLAVDEYNAIRNENVIKLAGGPGSTAFSVLRCANDGPK